MFRYCIFLIRNFFLWMIMHVQHVYLTTSSFNTSLDATSDFTCCGCASCLFASIVMCDSRISLARLSMSSSNTSLDVREGGRLAFYFVSWEKSFSPKQIQSIKLTSHSHCQLFLSQIFNNKTNNTNNIKRKLMKIDRKF